MGGRVPWFRNDEMHVQLESADEEPLDVGETTMPVVFSSCQQAKRKIGELHRW